MVHRLFAGLFGALLCLPVMAAPQDAQPAISYTRDIQPIFTEKCVACHACNDAACQLNLGSAEGADRGASKMPVYEGDRTRAIDPSRIFFDAQTTEAWRKKGFYSVLERQGSQAALMARMLEFGHATPLTPNAKLPDTIVLGLNRENMCPMPVEFDGYAKSHPGQGMPLAVTGLTDKQYDTLQRWLAEGAKVERVQVAPTANEASQIADWEALLNRPGSTEALVARWLYEHLFIAHIHFEGGPNDHFFQWVRSRTPSGKPVDLISTRRPDDDPGTEFYYRLIPVQGVIVHKTHIVYPMGPAKLTRVKQLFYGGDWHATELPGYGPQRRANPFETFQAIPAVARYQFMLDNAEYFVDTFIRGPVCRGQIATDVIRDHFWALFQEPARDRYVTDAAYRSKATPLLAMPGQNDSVGSVLSLWHSARDNRNDYAKLRYAAYSEMEAPDWSTLWVGNDNALLTIFRHFDSATVTKGLVGDVPQTIWLFDYPLLERTYYQLVVNFDVYGNVSHQLQTRLYFDLIRNGAELNFLRLMPADMRHKLLDGWYENGGQFKMWLDYTKVEDDVPTGLNLDHANPVRDFGRQLLARSESLNAHPDPINLCRSALCARKDADKTFQDVEDELSRLASRPALGLPAINLMPEATMLRVKARSGERVIYSVLRNRAHSNVAFLLGEEHRWQPRLDTLTIYPGVLSSYPNFMFDVPAEQVPQFVQAMLEVKDQTGFEKTIIERWGVRRSNPQFWDYFHDLDRYLRETDPLRAGVLDMNRYENL